MSKANRASARSNGNTSGITAAKQSNNSASLREGTEADLYLLDLLETAKRSGAILLIPGDYVLVDGLSYAVEVRGDGGVVLRGAKDSHVVHYAGCSWRA